MKTIHNGDAEVAIVGGVLVGVDATSEVVRQKKVTWWTMMCCVCCYQ